MKKNIFYKNNIFLSQTFNKMKIKLYNVRGDKNGEGRKRIRKE